MEIHSSSSYKIVLLLAAFAPSILAVESASAAAFVTNAPLHVARRAHTATLLSDGKVLVAGGLDNNSDSLSSAELFDPANGNWQPTGSLTNGHALHTATRLLNGKVLVAGGLGSASAELYDPALGTWTNLAYMHTARNGHSATLLPNGKVLVAGGNTEIDISTPKAEVYDPATDTWSEVGLMSSPRWRHAAILLPNGKVLVAGGGERSSSNFIVLATAEVYDPVTETWTNTASMSAARFEHPSTLLPNGTILISGGYDNTNFLSSTEFYDPMPGTWTNGAALRIARDMPTETLLQSGEVLVTGGFGISSTELYNPTLAVWTTNGSMASPRWEHTATLLASGKVLVAGGYDGASLLASTEIYDPGSVATPTPPVLTGEMILPDGSFRFTFASSAGAAFTALATTNLSQPLSNWTVLGGVPETSPGQFQFTDPQATNGPQRFYLVRSP